MNDSDDTIDFRRSVVQKVEKFLITNGGIINGSDNHGGEYDSITEFWTLMGLLPSSDKTRTKEEEEEAGFNRDWYKKTYDYWEDEDKCPSDVDGMLGGFGSISGCDLKFSRLFLEDVIKIRPQLNVRGDGAASCDYGAGIGRVTRGLLLPFGFRRCDLIEPSPRILSSAPNYIEHYFTTTTDNIEPQHKQQQKCRYINSNLQSFEPKPNSYDVIWIQWVIGYLTDWDCVLFFKRMKPALREGGVVILKDNTTNPVVGGDNAEGDVVFSVDMDDLFVTRSLSYLIYLAGLGGLEVVYQREQDDFPEEIYPVPMIAFQAST